MHNKYCITKIPDENSADIFAAAHKNYKFYWDKAYAELNPHDIPLRKLKSLSFREIDSRAKELMREDVKAETEEKVENTVKIEDKSDEQIPDFL